MSTRENITLADFYNQRFRNNAYNLTEISHIERFSIHYLLTQISKKNNSHTQTEPVITIIDFGCGDGRLHPLYESISCELFNIGMKLTIIAIDISEEALTSYHDRCMKSGYKPLTQMQKNNKLLHEQTNDITNYPIQKDNIELFFKTSDINGLMQLSQTELSVDAIIAAGVICHILGPENRLDMLNIFFHTAESLFLSQPTSADFATTQKQFSELRRRRKILQSILETKKLSKTAHDKLIAELSAVNIKLKDALSDGEIYYKAGWVRGMDRKLPDLKNHSVPYYGTTEMDAKSLLEKVGYKHCITYRGGFGNHANWIISLASKQYFSD